MGLDYDGRRFQPVDHGGDSSLAGEEVPTGHYHQSGDMVWAEFAGSHVRLGRLVGRCRPDGTIEAAYCHLTAAGELVAGRVESTPTVLADGRVRLAERWQRIDGTSGISTIEEVEAT